MEKEPATEPSVIQGIDKKVFESLFKTYFDPLCRFAYKYVKDDDASKEIVHDVFVNLWEKRATIDPEKAVKSYLFTSVYNRSLNRLRDTKKFKDQDDSVLNTFEGIHSRSDEHLAEAELSAAIHQAISELPEKCRAVFTYSRWEEKKYQEIADIMGISIKTVEVQMTKALKHMRERLSTYLKSE